ncbi:MAG TPA: biotin carboxylase N-terminal domain-containing protein, partial [Anaerolineales bacterium]
MPRSTGLHPARWRRATWAAGPAAGSYLNIPALLDAARRVEADAVHPGVGFLAENAEFARACEQAGLIFIGPSPQAIIAMGDKQAAKEAAVRLGIPVIPGYGEAGQPDADLMREASRIGFPVVIKAAAGGGGRGMRWVSEQAGLEEALASCRGEAARAFGSDDLILEKALRSPRHIEFQILGDLHGRVIHLGERECSLQRRHQKVIEEAPSTALTPELRAAMGAAAVALAQAAGYSGAGTVEFLLDGEGSFYFLEMNTRLQVEHPVTECLTGLDLVEWQIRVAEGQPLPPWMGAPPDGGHAIEARVYAENPQRDFAPAAGKVLLWRPPQVEGVRVDSGVETGSEAPAYYDGLLAKLIACASDRPAAIRKLRRALQETVLLGLPSNLAYLDAALADPAFQQGELSTTFLADRLPDWRDPGGDRLLALLAASLAEQGSQSKAGSGLGYWRNNPNGPQTYGFSLAGEPEPVEVSLSLAGGCYQASLSTAPDEIHRVEWASAGPDGEELALVVDGLRRRVTLARAGETWWVHTAAGIVQLQRIKRLPEPQPPADAGGSLRAPMPGTILEVLVHPGQT